jgi:hypothetical protein
MNDIAPSGPAPSESRKISPVVPRDSTNEVTEYTPVSVQKCFLISSHAINSIADAAIYLTGSTLPEHSRYPSIVPINAGSILRLPENAAVNETPNGANPPNITVLDINSAVSEIKIDTFKLDSSFEMLRCRLVFLE